MFRELIATAVLIAFFSASLALSTDFVVPASPVGNATTPETPATASASPLTGRSGEFADRVRGAYGQAKDALLRVSF